MRKTRLLGIVMATAFAGAQGCGAQADDGLDVGEGTSVTGGESEVDSTSQELRGGAQGWAWVNGTGNAHADYRFNSHSAALDEVSTSSTGTGVFTVRFRGLGAPAGDVGNAQVVAYGPASDNTRCKLASVARSGTDINVGVRCHSPAGAARNSAFVVRYMKAPSPSQGLGSYLRIDNPSAASPTIVSNWNANGSTNFVQKTGLGAYTVLIGTHASGGGSAQVTAFGTENTNHCKIKEVDPAGSPQKVDILCFNNAGFAADTRWSLNYIGIHANTVGFSNRGAYVKANDPIAASYFPDPTWARNTGTTAAGCAVQDIAGRNPNPALGYIIRHGQQPEIGGSPHVTAYGTNVSYCKLIVWDGPADGSFVDVGTQCFSGTGAITTSQYMENYATHTGRGPC